MKPFSFLLCLGLLATSLFAAEGQKPAITYQGRLTSTDTSASLSSSILITFSLYTQATGGDAVWRETVSVTPDTEGYFSVTLFEGCGSKEETTPATLGEALVRGHQTNGLWLGLIIGKDSTAELVPRHAVGIVPKAHRARTANRAQTPFHVPNTLFTTDVQADRLTTDTCTIDAAAAPAGLQNETLNAQKITVTRELNVEKEATFKSLTFGTAPESSDIVPLGAIILWYGDENAIPDGWERVETLAGRFPRGASDTRKPGQSGGSATVTLDANQLPPHSHTVSYNRPYATTGYTYAASSSSGGEETWVNTTSKDVTLKANAAHQNKPVNLLPPYKALHYIKRIK